MEEILKARRENTLTIRFLAQTIINDCLFPNQIGIKKLLMKARNYHHVKLEESNNKFTYAFLFHLEDYMEVENRDKSEIDLIIVQDKTLFLIEVKAFSDANSLGVKREIVRNYLRIKEIMNGGKYFQNISRIIPILLYSIPFQEFVRKGNNFDYFNENFLLKKGVKQKNDIIAADLQKGNYSIIEVLIKNEISIHEEIRGINENMFFLTWNDVIDICKEINSERKLCNHILEMEEKADAFNTQSDYPIKLIK